MTMDIQKLSVAYIRQGLMVTVAQALIAFLSSYDLINLDKLYHETSKPPMDYP